MNQVIERIILDKPRADVTEEQLKTANDVGRALLLAIPGVETVSFGIALAADERCQWVRANPISRRASSTNVRDTSQPLELCGTVLGAAARRSQCQRLSP